MGETIEAPGVGEASDRVKPWTIAAITRGLIDRSSQALDRPGACAHA